VQNITRGWDAKTTTKKKKEKKVNLFTSYKKHCGSTDFAEIFWLF